MLDKTYLLIYKLSLYKLVSSNVQKPDVNVLFKLGDALFLFFVFFFLKLIYSPAFIVTLSASRLGERLTGDIPINSS